MHAPHIIFINKYIYVVGPYVEISPPYCLPNKVKSH